MGSGVGESWEVVFVDDGSKDRSLPMLTELAAAEPRYKVSLSRNFGHQMAITAGVDRAERRGGGGDGRRSAGSARGGARDAGRWREGFDVVYAVRSKRHGETSFKRLTAALFYRFLRAMLGV